MHLTFDQWIKLLEAVGGLGTFGTFLHQFWRRMLKPLFMKLFEVIEEERKFRVETRETIKYVAEFRSIVEELKLLLETDELKEFVDILKWASAMRRYADVRVTTKAKSKTATTGHDGPNGGLQ